MTLAKGARDCSGSSISQKKKKMKNKSHAKGALLEDEVGKIIIMSTTSFRHAFIQ